jgi:uncharacterized protein YdeI (YjbR/CyaY-like superfamily)
MNKTNPKVDAFLRRTKQWGKEFEKLRAIILGLGLGEELKWGWPCYTFEGANVVLMHGFKEYCALLFFKGVLLKDPTRILIQQTENVQAGRQIRFTNVRQIAEMAGVLKDYVRRAVEVEKAGLKVELKKTAEYKIPPEFKKKLDEKPALKAAFKSLTPGRQRGYIFYFSSAKQAKTREARLEKCIPRILEGKGLDD